MSNNKKKYLGLEKLCVSLIQSTCKNAMKSLAQGGRWEDTDTDWRSAEER